jgi:acid phosphatase family membrane protein YuiD
VIINDIIGNKVIFAGIIGWAVAQILKVVTNSLKIKEVDLSRIIGSGGMPSSHSSFVMAVAVKTGMETGFDSPMFALAIAFAVVVMYDAAGVRRAAGNQAKVLNLIISDLSHKKGLQQDRLKELIGHTPFEVIAGAILGIFIGLIV